MKPKAYNGNKPFVFVSYCHEDNTIVHAFISELQKSVNVWFDEGNTPGSSFKDNIIEHINNCSLFLFYVTESSLASPYCRREIEFAMNKKKNFINVVDHDLSYPDWFIFDFQNILDYRLWEHKGKEIEELIGRSYSLFESCLVDQDETIEEPIRIVKPIKETPIEKENSKELPSPKLPILKNKWIAPPTELLLDDESNNKSEALNELKAEQYKDVINSTLRENNVDASIASYAVGSSFTRFHFKLGKNTSIKELFLLKDDIQIKLGDSPILLHQISHEQSFVGLDVAHAFPSTIGFKEVYQSLPNANEHHLAIGFGKNVYGEVIGADLDEFPHLLIAGEKGSGKTNFIHSMILSLIMRNSPNDLRLVLMDPQKIELERYKDMPHLLCPIISEKDKAERALDKLCQIMNYRYELFIKRRSRDIKEYNDNAKMFGFDKIPYIVVIIDNYDTFFNQIKLANIALLTLIQKARAAGIYLCIACERATTSTITGVMKANMPTRIAFKAAGYMDSMVILDEGGAETLSSPGDMLVKSHLVSRTGLDRFQSCLVQRQEIKHIIVYLKDRYLTVYDDFMLS